MNFHIWLPSLLAALVLFQLVAIPALLLKRNDFADVLWGPAFPLSALAGAEWGLPGGLRNLGARAILVFLLLGIWALRLFLHVGIRNLRKKEEDVRYRKWRLEWGSTQVWRSYLQVWILQPLILFVFLIPVLWSLASPSRPFGLLSFVGGTLWLVGFLFETIGDEQLRRHQANPKTRGRLITTGLWSWSRHPNYFGEVVIWWGIWLLVAELPYSTIALVGPLSVSYLLWKVSGVSMTEELMRKREGFQEYAARTSIFFPWPPKKEPAITA